MRQSPRRCAAAMIAVDTNVVVRLLTWDDPVQAEQAKALFRSNEVYISKSVLLETEWVLRSLYGFESQGIGDALRGLVGLENLRCEDLGSVTKALEWSGQGLDFADALHLASSVAAKRFATFDDRLRKRAQGVSGIQVVAADKV